MKNLITVIASMLILLAFVTQFFANQVTHNNMARIEREVCTFVDTAKQDGCISENNIVGLKAGIASILNCGEKEISVSGTTGIVYRGGIIDYKIKIPLKNLFSASNFWNFSNEENERYMILKQSTVSEKLDRRI